MQDKGKMGNIQNKHPHYTGRIWKKYSMPGATGSLAMSLRSTVIAQMMTVSSSYQCLPNPKLKILLWAYGIDALGLLKFDVLEKVVSLLNLGSFCRATRLGSFVTQGLQLGKPGQGTVKTLLNNYYKSNEKLLTVANKQVRLLGGLHSFERNAKQRSVINNQYCFSRQNWHIRKVLYTGNLVNNANPVRNYVLINTSLSSHAHSSHKMVEYMLGRVFSRIIDLRSSFNAIFNRDEGDIKKYFFNRKEERANRIIIPKHQIKHSNIVTSFLSDNSVRMSKGDLKGWRYRSLFSLIRYAFMNTLCFDGGSPGKNGAGFFRPVTLMGAKSIGSKSDLEVSSTRSLSVVSDFSKLTKSSIFLGQYLYPRKHDDGSFFNRCTRYSLSELAVRYSKNALSRRIFLRSDTAKPKRESDKFDFTGAVKLWACMPLPKHSLFNNAIKKIAFVNEHKNSIRTVLKGIDASVSKASNRYARSSLSVPLSDKQDRLSKTLLELTRSDASKARVKTSVAQEALSGLKTEIVSLQKSNHSDMRAVLSVLQSLEKSAEKMANSNPSRVSIRPLSFFGSN